MQEKMNTNKPKVAVLIPTKNGGAIIVALKTQWPVEILVIDSRSNDNTVETCRRYPEVHLHIIRPKEFGHGEAHTLGVSVARSQLIALITQDEQPVSEHWQEAIFAAIEPNPTIAGVFGRQIAYSCAKSFTTQAVEIQFADFYAWALVSLDEPKHYARDQSYQQVLHFFSDNYIQIRHSVRKVQPYSDVDFDEAYAFHRLFGYVPSPERRPQIFPRLALTWRNMVFTRVNKLRWLHTRSVLRVAFDNFTRLADHYLGSRFNRLPEALRPRLSRDTKLILGQRTDMREAIEL